jgi:hypothetical protein
VRASSTVIAGAPVNPSSARRTAIMPVSAPMPEPSCSIVGLAISRIIWLRGPWYSAMPSAWRRVSGRRPLQATAERRDAKPVPRAGGVVIGDAGVQRHGGARGDLVGHDHGGQRLAPGQVGLAWASTQRAGTTAQPIWPLVSFSPSWASRLSIWLASAKRRTGQRRHAPVEEERRGVRRRLDADGTHRVVPRDAPAFHGRGPGGDAQRVDQQRRGGVERGVGNVEWAEAKAAILSNVMGGASPAGGRSPGRARRC